MVQKIGRYPWAELLWRVFLIEVLVCPRCGGPWRLLAAIQDPESIVQALSSQTDEGLVSAGGS